MAGDFFSTPIEFLKGVGPVRAELLRKELDIHTFEQLLHYFPFRYIDRSQFLLISDIDSEEVWIQIKGRISQLRETGTGRARRLTGVFTDSSGSVGLVWFQGVRWVKEKIKPNLEYVAFGKPTLFNGQWQLAHPEIEAVIDLEAGPGATLQPVYNSGEKLRQRGLDSRGLARLTRTLVSMIAEPMPETLQIGRASCRERV